MAPAPSRLLAHNTYTGETIVDDGTLVCTGSIANSTTTVLRGGILGGTGTTGAVTIAAGGTLGPGHEPRHSDDRQPVLLGRRDICGGARGRRCPARSTAWR